MLVRTGLGRCKHNGQFGYLGVQCLSIKRQLWKLSSSFGNDGHFLSSDSLPVWGDRTLDNWEALYVCWLCKQVKFPLLTQGTGNQVLPLVKQEQSS